MIDPVQCPKNKVLSVVSIIYSRETLWTKFLDERAVLVNMTEIKYHAVCRTLHFYIRCKRSHNIEQINMVFSYKNF